MTAVSERLKTLQIKLPEIPPPVVDGYFPLFVPCVRTGNVIYLSGRIAKKTASLSPAKSGNKSQLRRASRPHAASP